MSPIVTTSKVVLAAALISAMFAGCERRPADQTSGAASTSPPSTSSTSSSTMMPGTAATDSSGNTAGAGTSSTAGSSMAPSDTSGASDASSSKTMGTAVEDSVITAKIKTALLGDPDVKSLDITVDTSKGEVVLSGVVDNKSQIEKAEKVAQNIEGVQKVNNKLAVKK